MGVLIHCVIMSRYNDLNDQLVGLDIEGEENEESFEGEVEDAIRKVLNGEKYKW